MCMLFSSTSIQDKFSIIKSGITTFLFVIDVGKICFSRISEVTLHAKGKGNCKQTNIVDCYNVVL